MQRFHASLLTAALISGCAFDDGNPWGQAEFSLEAGFDPPTSRLDEGRLRTAKDYLVELDEIAVTFATIEIEIATSGEAGAFDPANPPEGYSLCHNGHCHAADGSLVDYDEIEVTQSGGDFLVVQTIDESVALDSALAPVSLGECVDDCRLQRGELGLVRLRLSELRLTGTVSDLRDRLAEPLDLDVTVPIDAALASPISGSISPGEPGLATVELDFQLSAGFLDGIDFASGGVDAESIDLSDALDVDVEMQDL